MVTPRAILTALLLSVAASPGVFAQTAQTSQTTPPANPPLEQKDRGVQPTHHGSVIGQVYDAATGAPIAGAAVSIQEEGAFREDARKPTLTDAAGRYKGKAGIGRVSQNLDIGRLLSTGIFGLLGGGATNKTQRIDVSRLNLRITREGYEPFEGVVLCRALVPEGFFVVMEPVLLARKGSGHVSATAPGWGTIRMTELRVEPAIVAPGETATVTAVIQSPPVLKLKDLKVRCLYVEGDKVHAKDMKPQPDAGDGTLLATYVIKAPKAKQQAAMDIAAIIIEAPYDLASGRGGKPALLQVVTTEAERKTAARRAEAYRLFREDENAKAAALWQEICTTPEATRWDFDRLATVSEAVNDTKTAAMARRRVAELTPAKERLRADSQVAAALVANGEGQAAIREFQPVVQQVKEGERPKRIPALMMVALGEAYLQAGNLEEAESINQQLLKWKEAAQTPRLAEFRNALRLAQAESKVKGEPDNATARADYGRVLMDLGRWEEAATELQTAAKMDGSLPAVRRDYAYALLHIRGGAEEAVPSLDAALASAEREVQIDEGKGKVGKSKDFFAWHTLAILRYVKASRLQATDPNGAAETYRASREALREALKIGRTGAKVDPGNFNFLWGYTSPSVKAIAGFAYPEADTDFVILESLYALDRDPNDFLAHFNLATAFTDLRQPEIAQASLKRARELKPDDVEARYVEALLAMQTGEREAAMTALREVVQRNPLHPKANLDLARLYTEDGDMAAAAASLAAHAKVYGGA